MPHMNVLDLAVILEMPLLHRKFIRYSRGMRLERERDIWKYKLGVGVTPKL